MISIPDTVTTIGDKAFYNCISLSNIYIPDSVKTIGEYSFYGCDKIHVYCKTKYSQTVITLIDNDISFTALTSEKNKNGLVTINQDKSYYTTVFSSSNNGGSILFTCNYEFKDEYYNVLKNKKIKIKIPKNSTLIEKTLLNDGELCTDYEINNGILSIPIDQKKGKISFSLKKEGNSTIVSYAIMEYLYNGKSKYDIIDVINDKVPFISLETKSVTNTNSFVVNGIAPADNFVDIFVNDKYFDTVKTNKSGHYSATVSLSNPTDGEKYIVKAETEADGENVKATSNIQYSTSTPTMTSFTMTYNGKTYDMMSDVKHNITFASNRIPTFKVKFTNPENVMSVYISSERSNIAKRIKASWNEKEKAFVVTGYFDKENTGYVPGKINVYYSEKGSYDEFAQNIEYDQKAYDDYFDGATAEVIKDTKDETEIVITHKDGDKTTVSSEKTTLEKGLKEILGDEKYAEYIATKAPLSVTAKVTNTKAKILTGDDSEDNILYKFLKDAGKKVVKTVIADGVESIVVQDVSEQGDIYTYVVDTVSDSVKKTAIKTAGKYLTTEFLAYQAGEAVASEATKEMGGFVWSAGYGIYKAADYGISTNLDIDAAKRSVEYSGKSQAEKEYLNKTLDNYRSEANAIAFMKATCSFLDAAVTLSGAGFTPQGLALKAGLFIVSDIILDMAEKDLDNRIKYLQGNPNDTSVNWAIDPSGYVYAGVTNNRLSNVKTTLYYIPFNADDETYWDKPDESKEQVWEAEEYSQENPLYTDDDGNYAWDVPEGWWRVKYELSGYKTTYSEWMQVPPPQTNVHINMIKELNPKVESITFNEAGNIEVLFDTYMKPESVKNIIIKNLENDSIEYNLIYNKTETDTSGTVYSKSFVLDADIDLNESNISSVYVPKTVVSYYDVSSETYTKEFGTPIAETTEATQPSSDNPTEQTQPVTDNPTEPHTDNPTEPTQSVTESPKTKKKPNPVKITVKTKTVKLKKLKKKAQKVKAITVKNAKGKVTYKLVKSGITKKIRKLIKINSKGVITIKCWKKAKKGTYKIKVHITVQGNSKYKPKTVNKVVKVKIK